MTWLKNL
jgi:hypothetical protein